jgi:hypothetical protein
MPFVQGDDLLLDPVDRPDVLVERVVPPVALLLATRGRVLRDEQRVAQALEQVVALDRLNPQVASRLARAFDRWKKYDAGRQAHARKALEMIKGTPGLSGNVGEVVQRALA